MALRGLKPVVEIMFGDFIGLCFDQLYNHAAKYRAMYADQVEVPLVVRTPVGAGRGYGPTHSQSPEKHLLGIPHLKVVAPTLFHDPGALLEAAIADPEPVVFVEHKLLYPARLAAPHGAGAGNGDGGVDRRLWVDRLEGGDGRYPTARVANFADGDGPADVLLVTYGGGSRHLEDLLLRLADDEIRVACLLPSLINRFEVEPLAEAARGAGAGCVVWEEGPRGFDWGAEVVARLHEALDDRPGGAAVRIRRLASWPTVVPAARHLEDMILPGPAEVERAIVELLADSLR